MTTRRSVVLLLAGCLLHLSCLEAIPKAKPNELARGLIVIYPGISSAPTDMVNWNTALRNAGIKQAIEMKPYGPTFDFFGNLMDYDRNRAWSEGEALRIAAYIDAFPHRPVTLIGYSGGGAIAPMVAESLPQGYDVDRILLFSSGLSPSYDLSPALAHSEKGIVHFWSEADVIGPLITLAFGTMDREYTVPAALVGFETRDERLIEFAWTPDMVEYDNRGDHTDYLWHDRWAETFIAPWITRNDGRETFPIPPELEGRILVTTGQ